LAAVHSVACIPIIARTAVRLKVAERVTAISIGGIAVVALLARIHVTVSALGSSCAVGSTIFTTILRTSFVPVADEITADTSQAVSRTGLGSFGTVADGIAAVAIGTGLRILYAGVARQVSAESAIFGTRINVFPCLAELISAELVVHDLFLNIEDEVSGISFKKTVDNDDDFCSGGKRNWNSGIERRIRKIADDAGVLTGVAEDTGRIREYYIKDHRVVGAQRIKDILAVGGSRPNISPIFRCASPAVTREIIAASDGAARLYRRTHYRAEITVDTWVAVADTIAVIEVDLPVLVVVNSIDAEISCYRSWRRPFGRFNIEDKTVRSSTVAVDDDEDLSSGGKKERFSGRV
jgi:hypothetical protein